ncbi:carboxypeptidase-like regulatory domain-containing protein [Corallococcus terminator]|uniref:Carboxypeptidase regulatory-like domain-containing protein n=1 Tax=Corallococcus terminator TaxID=2316733 RepID=A0A3A8J6L2_9BACT|nr:carboxypeptidase-like regulatory domain-containing protein [Corallococcus terminator]RKG86141.1 carboxypeptidase regulatory-like domain-containing protein [Corallococcus terminator]
MREANRGWLPGIGGIIGVLLLLALLYGSREAANPTSPASPSTGKSSTGARATKQAVRVIAGSPRITGTVSNEHGPVAGVRVSASRVEPGETLSELPCPADATEASSPRERPLPWTECGHRFEGEIQARVATREGEAHVLAETTTAQDGSFVLDGLTEGIVTLWALGEQGAAKQPDVATGSQDVALLLEEGVVFTGVVQEKGDAGPIAGARVTVFSRGHTRFFDALTDASGHFRVGPLPATDYAVLITAEGWTSLFFTGAHSLKYQPLWLERPVRVTGQVVSAQGAPAAGVDVMLTATLFDTRRRFTTTDATGRFTFESAHPPPHTLFAQTPSRDAFAVFRSKESDPPVEPVLQLEPAVFLQGTVRDDAGQAIVDARVTARSNVEGAIASGEAFALTDAEGHYRLGPLMTGAHSLGVQAAHHLDLPSDEQSIDARTEPLDFTLTRAVSVEGILVDTDGQPLPGRTVSLRRGTGFRWERDREEETVTTDEAGGFVVDARREGEGALFLEEDDLVTERLEVRIPSRDVRFVVRRGGEVSGILLSANGVPMEGTRVTLWSAGKLDIDNRTDLTDGHGRFTLRGIPSGHFMVEASFQTDALEVIATQPVEVVEGQRVDGSLRFPEGRTVSGIAVDPTGRPLEGARVRASIPSEDTPNWQQGRGFCGNGQPEGVRTDKEGRFVLKNLSAPRYDLFVWLEGHDFDPVHSRGGTAVKRRWRIGEEAQDLRLILKRSPVLRGRVVDEGGQPLTAFSVNGSRVTSEDGTFEQPPGPSEGRRLVVRALDFAPLERTLTLPDEGDLDVGVLTLSRGRTVRGVLHDARTGALFTGRGAASPPSRVRVQIQQAGATRALTLQQVVPAPDGTLVFKHLPATALTLRLEVDGYLPLQRTLAAEEQTFKDVLDPGASVEFQVRDTRGQPLASTVVLLEADGTSHVHEAPQGMVRVQALPPGLYWMQAEPVDKDSEERFRPEPLRIPASGPVAVTLEALKEGSTLHLNMADDIDFALLIPGPVPFPESLQATGLLQKQSHPMQWRDGPPKVATFQHLPGGRYTLFAMGRNGDRLHREELEVPTVGEHSRDVRAVWRPLEP